MTWLPAPLTPIVMLLCSNVFMTFAWYGHLKFTDRPLWLVILASWGIAFIEYCLAVPANRWGHAVYSTAELKTMQEVITLTVFACSRCSISASASRSTTWWASPSFAWARSSSSRARCRPEDVG